MHSNLIRGEVFCHSRFFRCLWIDIIGFVSFGGKNKKSIQWEDWAEEDWKKAANRCKVLENIFGKNENNEKELGKAIEGEKEMKYYEQGIKQ